MLLQVKDLHTYYGNIKALRGVSFYVDEGEVYGFFGPNGAGKSTLSAVLTGNPAYEVTAGEVYLKGQERLQKIHKMI